VAAGGSCRADAECTNGYCYAIPGCPGECKSFVASGGDCTSGVCGPSDYCDTMGKTCVPRLAIGTQCTNLLSCQSPASCVNGTCTDGVGHGAQGTMCFGDFPLQCAPGLYCDLMQHACVPVLAAGAACDRELACADGLTCMLHGGGLGNCAPFIDVGRPCDPTFSVGCTRSAMCDAASKICQSRYVAAGATCMQDANCLTFQPGPSLYCASGQCVSAPGPGDPCTLPDGGAFDRCDFLTSCDLTKGICTAPCQ
jgi:hypothetical protein